MTLQLICGRWWPILCPPYGVTAPVSIRFPLCRPRPAPRSMSSPGGFACRSSFRVSMYMNCPPLVHLQILASSGSGVRVGWIFAKGEIPRCLHYLAVAHPGPCPWLLGHDGTVKVTPPPPYWPHDTIPVGRQSVGINARSWCNLLTNQSW